MPRLTHAQALALCRGTIRAWKLKSRPDRPITISVLAEKTGLTPTHCENLAKEHQLDVCLTRRDTLRGEISESYCAGLETFRDWCEHSGRNLRLTTLQALREFQNRRKL